MSNQIVTVNVSQTLAPAPSQLQRTGAFISQGATTTAPGTKSLITQMADLTAILTGAKAIASAVWSGSVVTVTTAAPHGYTVSDTLSLTVAGMTPSGYNGTFNATITGASTFTYPLVSNPGSATVQGVVTVEDVAELVAMGTTFFAQGNAVSVYVLELGAGNAADGVTYLTTWIAANPNVFYSYLVPRYWAPEATFLAFLASFEATTAKTYFFITATTGNYTGFTALMKCAYVMIEAPSIPVTEFSLAGDFYNTLHYNPSTTNKVTPKCFGYIVGVTPYPTAGNAVLLNTLKTSSVNVIGTGAEGGISNTLVLWGTTKDGRDFTYWYSVDWLQINLDLDLSNEIINGSNNPIAPLYYDQPGINRLQARAQSTVNRWITFGMGNGPATVNAVPFLKYTTDNPSDYPIGKYAGLSVTAVPSRGFIQIIFNLNVTDFIAA